MKQSYFIIIIVILSVFVLGLGIYFWNNYNQFTIYTFEGTDSKFSVSGNATFSKKYHVLNINQITYTGYDFPIKEIRISMFAKIGEKERLIVSDLKTWEEPVSIQDYLKTYTNVISERYGYQEYFNQTIIKKFPHIVFLRIEGIDGSNQPFETVLSLTCKTYANNQWFYQKSNHI